jgi:hypothetical protein
MRKMRKLDAVAQLQPKQGHPILAAMAPAAARVAMAMALATTAAGFTLPPSHVISPSLKLGIATVPRNSLRAMVVVSLVLSVPACMHDTRCYTTWQVGTVYLRVSSELSRPVRIQ